MNIYYDYARKQGYQFLIRRQWVHEGGLWEIYKNYTWFKFFGIEFGYWKYIKVLNTHEEAKEFVETQQSPLVI